MKAHLVFLSLAMTVGNCLQSATNVQNLLLNEVTLRMAFVSPDGKGGYTNVAVISAGASHVSLTFSNATSHAGALRLPGGIREQEYPPSFPRAPWLELLVTEPKSGAQEEIGFATFTKSPESSATIPLAPGETHTSTYALSDFYLWGPGGPNVTRGIWTYLTPGDVELTVVALIFDKDKDGTLTSNSETMHRAFPDILFRKKKVEPNPTREGYHPKQ